MTIHEAQEILIFELVHIYDEREAGAITDWVMENLTGSPKIDRILNKSGVLTIKTEERLKKIINDLVHHIPVQYILNEAWFHGMKMFVNENVLIPRPETEELVQWAIAELKKKENKINTALQILDVGTGSGCIAISLKKEFPKAEISAIDVSKEAMSVGEKNAGQFKTNIHFKQLDFLNENKWDSLPDFDVVISNPPYISEQEKNEIDKNVLQNEPHLALFVPAEDSLVFYRKLSEFGNIHLTKDGFMMMEIHYLKGPEVKEVFESCGYKTELRKDMHGNDRMIKVYH